MINETNKSLLYPLHKGDSHLEVYVILPILFLSACVCLSLLKTKGEIASQKKYEVFRKSREKSKNLMLEVKYMYKQSRKWKKEMFQMRTSLDLSLGTASSLQKNHFNENLGSYQHKYLRIKCIKYIDRGRFFNCKMGRLNQISEFQTGSAELWD